MAAITQFNTTPVTHPVPNARKLIDTSVRPICEKLAKCIGKAFDHFVLAQIAQIADIVNDFEGETPFPDTLLKDGKVFETFDGIISGSPRRAKQPIRMTPEARMGMTALALGIADLTNNCDGVSHLDLLTEIADQGVQQSAIIRVMLCSIGASRERLNMKYLSRDFNFHSEIGGYIEQLVDATPNNHKYVEAISTTIVDFIKVVALQAATRGCETNGLVFNGKELLVTIALLGLYLPGGESSITQGVTMYIREQTSEWNDTIAVERLNKAQRKPRVTKAVVAPAAISEGFKGKSNDIAAEDIDIDLEDADAHVAASQGLEYADGQLVIF